MVSICILFWLYFTQPLSVAVMQWKILLQLYRTLPVKFMNFCELIPNLKFFVIHGPKSHNLKTRCYKIAKGLRRLQACIIEELSLKGHAG